MGSQDGPGDRELWRLAGDGDSAAFGELASDHADAVATAVDSERRMAEVRRAVAELPRHEREVVELCAWSGPDQKAAAVTLGVSVGTVKSRMHRARRRLAARVGDDRGGVTTAREAR